MSSSVASISKDLKTSLISFADILPDLSLFLNLLIYDIKYKAIQNKLRIKNVKRFAHFLKFDFNLLKIFKFYFY